MVMGVSVLRIPLRTTSMVSGFSRNSSSLIKSLLKRSIAMVIICDWLSPVRDLQNSICFRVRSAHWNEVFFLPANVCFLLCFILLFFVF